TLMPKDRAGNVVGYERDQMTQGFITNVSNRKDRLGAWERRIAFAQVRCQPVLVELRRSIATTDRRARAVEIVAVDERVPVVVDTIAAVLTPRTAVESGVHTAISR